jgi:protein SCO1/2
VAAWLIVAVLLGIVVWVAVQPALEGDKGHPAPPTEPAVPTSILPESPGALLDYPALDSTGAELSTHDLLGKFLVVDFIFTNCPGPCIPMAEEMKKLNDALEGVDDVQIVSFTVDPERDSPEVLAEYAKKVGADPDRWKFLFTAKGRVHKIAFEGMKLGDENDPIIHSNRFALLDREGKLRAYYAPIKDPTWLDMLLADIDRLRAESAAE